MLKRFFTLFLIPAILGALLAEPSTITMDGPCTVVFSPEGGTTQAIVDLIHGATRSIRLLAYNFTSAEIGHALIEAKERGVDVKLILDKSVPHEKKSLLPAMLAAGIPAWIDRRHHIAHNKVIVVDESIIETGSFNFTDSAEHRNAENAVICPSVSGAALYLSDWERHRAHSDLALPEDEP